MFDFTENLVMNITLIAHLLYDKRELVRGTELTGDRLGTGQEQKEYFLP